MNEQENNIWLLVTDVDDTLFGDTEALARFAGIASGRENLKLCLNSSRPIKSIDRTLAQSPAHIEPDAVIGAMGTEMRVGGETLSLWSEAPDGWSRIPFDLVMKTLGFEPHDDEFQTPLKASYTVPAHRRAVTIAAIRGAKLQAKIVVSGESNFDILPPGWGKGTATAFVSAFMGVAPDRVVVSGDSGNDVEMFDAADRGIVVGNARDELKDRVDPDKTYFARLDHADGVLEGLHHWGALA